MVYGFGSLTLGLDSVDDFGSYVLIFGYGLRFLAICIYIWLWSIIAGHMHYDSWSCALVLSYCLWFLVICTCMWIWAMIPGHMCLFG